MLVLSRKSGEVIRIGEHIKVVVRGIQGRYVRLGIEAPAEIGIQREEYYLAIQSANSAASQLDQSEVASVCEEPKKEGKVMKIQTTRFGMVEVNEDKVFTFPQGIIGMPAYTKYVLIEHNAGSPFRWLQSVDDPRLAFAVTDPRIFIEEYQVQMKDSDKVLLGNSDEQEIAIAVICSVPVDNPTEATANLQAPLVLSPLTRRGVQVVMSDSNYPVKYFWNQNIIQASFP